MAGLAAGIQKYIVKNPNVFGGADIYNLDVQSPLSRAGMLVAVLTGLVDADRRPAARKFVVVVPPGLNEEDCEAQAWSEMLATFRLLYGREMEPFEQDWFRARFRTVAARDRRSRSVLDVIKTQSERTVVIVTDAASYRDDNVDPYVAPGASTPLRSEDVWAPQLHALASAAVELARQRMLYVALDANRAQPAPRGAVEPSALDRRLRRDGIEQRGDSDSIVAGRIDQWDAWIRAGHLGRALRDIEQLPAATTTSPISASRCFHKAGHFPQALQAIREEIASGRTLEASARVTLARIAQDANASRLANEILAPAVDELDSREDLESALATAHDTGSAELEERVAGRLAAMFPGSPGLRQRSRRALLAARDYAGVAAMAAEEPDDQANAEFYGRLARFLSGPDVPDYHALIASAGGDISRADAYRMACVSTTVATIISKGSSPSPAHSPRMMLVTRNRPGRRSPPSPDSSGIAAGRSGPIGDRKGPAAPRAHGAVGRQFPPAGRPSAGFA